jgi:uncharacterized protein YndB with AHSA1/START domain
MTLIHDTFTLDRSYAAAVKQVWQTWTDPELRPRWFRGPEGWQTLERRLDLRIGGHELLRGRAPTGMETRFESTFHVIVPEHHIVSVYDMYINATLLSVTLATLDLEAAGSATRLRYTEQGVYFGGDPEAPVSRKRGTSWHLDNLAELFAQ